MENSKDEFIKAVSEIYENNTYADMASILDEDYGIKVSAETVRGLCKKHRDIFPNKKTGVQTEGATFSSDSNIKTILCLADVHLEYGVPQSSAYKLVKDFARDIEIDEVAIMGDFLDFSSISKFNINKPRLREGKRLKEDFKIGNKELDFWGSIAKDKVTYLEGNHELRAQKYLDENAELEGLIEVPNLLKLKDRGIEYIPYNIEYQLYNSDMFLSHGCFHTKYHTQKTFEYYGRNIAYGHMHSIQATSRVMRGESEYISQSIGCLCDINAEYLQNKPSQYINGFGICYVDETTGGFTFLNIPITNNQFILNGKLYKYEARNEI